MKHDPLCGLTQPCDEEEPEHGYCSMQHGLFCIHCHQWCICNVIAKVREDERSKDLDYAYIAAQAEADGHRDMLAKCIKAIEQILKKDTRVPDLGEFRDGTGVRDPYERGVTRGMELVIVELRHLQDQR